jgi:hypothetical protein
MPPRPRPSTKEVDLNAAHAEMSTMRSVYSLLKQLNPDARKRVIDYISNLLVQESKAEDL